MTAFVNGIVKTVFKKNKEVVKIIQALDKIFFKFLILLQCLSCRVFTRNDKFPVIVLLKSIYMESFKMT